LLSLGNGSELDQRESQRGKETTALIVKKKKGKILAGLKEGAQALRDKTAKRGWGKKKKRVGPGKGKKEKKPLRKTCSLDWFTKAVEARSTATKRALRRAAPKENSVYWQREA